MLVAGELAGVRQQTQHAASHRCRRAPPGDSPQELLIQPLHTPLFLGTEAWIAIIPCLFPCNCNRTDSIFKVDILWLGLGKKILCMQHSYEEHLSQPYSTSHQNV